MPPGPTPIPQVAPILDALSDASLRDLCVAYHLTPAETDRVSCREALLRCEEVTAIEILRDLLDGDELARVQTALGDSFPTPPSTRRWWWRTLLPFSSLLLGLVVWIAWVVIDMPIFELRSPQGASADVPNVFVIVGRAIVCEAVAVLILVGWLVANHVRAKRNPPWED